MTTDNAIFSFGAFVLPLITNVIVLYYALIGYRRTKQPVFGVWILTSILGFIAVFALLGLRGSQSSLEHHGLWLFWSLDSILAGICATYGIILLMHHVLQHTTKMPDA